MSTPDKMSQPAAEWVPVVDLAPWDQNPRRNDDAAREVAKSIQRFGFGAPILARRSDGVVIAGHTRLKAAALLGLDKVPVRYLDLDPAEARALALADNKLGELADWDDALLGDVLRDLEAEGTSLDGLGFTDDELKALMADPVVGPSENDDDAPEVDEHGEPDSVLGGVYELGPHRLVCGDCTDAAVNGALLNGARPDAVIADPPYGMKLDTDYAARPLSAAATAKHPTQRSYRPVIGDHEDYDPSPVLAMFDDIAEVFLWGGDYFAKHLPTGGSWLVWDKREGIEDVEYSSSSFELCWSKEMHRRDIIRARWFGLCGMEREDTAKRVHPTQKPAGVITWIIERHVPEDGMVWDGFGGSGTTLIAAATLGRVARLIELDPRYCDVIRRRWTRWAHEHGRDPGPGALDG